jgi:hypothetical protein
MFSTPRVNLIESDEGFSVEVLGRTGLTYVDGGKAMFVDSEVLVAPASMAIYPGSITRWDGNPSDLVDEATRQTIVANIRRAFESQGHEIVVVG